MDRATMNVLVFRRTANDLELISSPSDEEECEEVAVYLPILEAA